MRTGVEDAAQATTMGAAGLGGRCGRSLPGDLPCSSIWIWLQLKPNASSPATSSGVLPHCLASAMMASCSHSHSVSAMQVRQRVGWGSPLGVGL
jgi:hypothetical protein